LAAGFCPKNKHGFARLRGLHGSYAYMLAKCEHTRCGLGW